MSNHNFGDSLSNGKLLIGSKPPSSFPTNISQKDSRKYTIELIQNQTIHTENTPKSIQVDATTSKSQINGHSHTIIKDSSSRYYITTNTSAHIIPKKNDMTVASERLPEQVTHIYYKTSTASFIVSKDNKIKLNEEVTTLADLNDNEVKLKAGFINDTIKRDSQSTSRIRNRTKDAKYTHPTENTLDNVELTTQIRKSEIPENTLERPIIPYEDILVKEDQGTGCCSWD